MTSLISSEMCFACQVDSEGIFELVKTFKDTPGKEIFFSFSHHNHDDYETETYDDGNTSESSTFNNANGTYEMSLNYKFPINEDVSLNWKSIKPL